MRRGTTPAIVLTVDADLTDYSVYVTIDSGCKQTIIGNERLSMSYADGATSIEFALTQEETLAFSPGQAEIQVRAVHNDTAVATDIRTVNIGRILQEGVIDEL